MTNKQRNDPDEDETVFIRPGKAGQARYTDARSSDSDQGGQKQSREIAGASKVVDPFETILLGNSWLTAEDNEATQILKPSRSAGGVSDQGSSPWDFDPIVALLLVISGPGKGAYRPLFYGNNSIGRSSKERVPLNFGDDAISNTEQSYIRYDHEDRQFLFIPNLAKSNIVSVDDQKPTGPVILNAGAIIKMGTTRLIFYPVCGPHFDWSDVEDQ